MVSLKKQVAFFAFLFSCILALQNTYANGQEDLKTEIYSKLECCACEVAFSKCVCPEALQMKAYVDALLEGQTTKDEVFYLIVKKFGLNVIIDQKLKSSLEERLKKEAGLERPQIVSELSAFDFGKVSKKQGKARKIIKLYNKGKVNLTVNNIRVSCGCVSASLRNGKIRSPYFGVSGAKRGWNSVIAPGKYAELEVVLDLAHESMGQGKQEREVIVSSSDPIYPETKIKVKIEVGD